MDTLESETPNMAEDQPVYGPSILQRVLPILIREKIALEALEQMEMNMQATDIELQNLRTEKQGLTIMLATIMDAIGKEEIRISKNEIKIGMRRLERCDAKRIELSKDSESGDLVLRLRSL